MIDPETDQAYRDRLLTRPYYQALGVAAISRVKVATGHELDQIGNSVACPRNYVLR